MMFGAALVTLLLGVGAAVDVGRWLHARSQTVAAIDAAVLAGGRALQVNSKDKSAAVDVAKKYYIQNVTSRLPVVGDTVNFGVASDGMGITASGKAYITTPFLNFAGVDKLPLITAAQTEFASSKIAVGGNGGQNIEVSVILDITGSMKGTKLSDLKEAAKDLVNIVIWDDQSQYYSKVALVPYSIGVNVGSSMANTVRGTISSGKKTTPGYQQYTFKNAANNSDTTFSVSNCVTERTGTNAYKDTSGKSSKVGRNYPASSNPCPSAQLIPLSSNKTTLTNAIDSYVATGSTAGHIGLAWGWYALSPNWSDVFTGTAAPAAYSKLTEIGPKGVPVLKKIAVLMTDGDFNTAYCNGVIAKNSGTGSGADSDHINCNATNGTSSDQALQLCAAMKATGIEVYTVGFDVGDQNVAKNLMNKCATDAGKVYIADNGDQLRDAFRDIALKLSSLYISK
jgi:Flp pilus assembly protein TadG